MRLRNLILMFGLVTLVGCGSLPEQNGGAPTARAPGYLMPTPIALPGGDEPGERGELSGLIREESPRAARSSYETSFEPVRPRARVPRQGANPGSLFQAGGTRGLYDDGRASTVGDILTIELAENTSASWTMSGSRAQSSNLDVENPTIFGAGVQFNAPAWLPLDDDADNDMSMAFSSTSDSDGSGDGSQDNSLTGEITVTVVEVLANGNLVVRGEKLMALAGNEEYIQISGIVRPRDIGSDNIVPSSRLANARIAYGGSEMIAHIGNRGWLGDFLGKVWPF